MRLTRLKIRNIASLRGEHEIDFQDIQRHSSLFAITGETGAGKSTILNSIGLALYGQIYKKNVQQIDVVTLGEKDGSIELIFQVKGKYYLADWRVRVRKQNGEPYSTPQSPVRTLYEVAGDEFSSPKNATNQSIAELLNLDFDQFCKCIILNQGEFARFLTSSFSERKEILEKLYPGELLESMGRELKAELTILEKKKNEIEIKLGELKGDHISGENLRLQKVELEKEFKILEQNYSGIDKLDYHFISLRSYFEKYQRNETNKNQIKADLALETTRFNELLKKGEGLSELATEAQAILSKELPKLQELAKKEETLKNLEEALAEKKKELSVVNFDIQNGEKKIAELNSDLQQQQTELSKTKKDIPFEIETIKNQKDNFDPFIDRFTERELLLEQQLGKKEKLQNLELTGHELKLLVKSFDDTLMLIPKDLKKKEEELALKRIIVQEQRENAQKRAILSEELIKDIDKLNEQNKKLNHDLEISSSRNKTLETEMTSLETTVKLQEIFNAREICLSQAIEENSLNCPVCETSIETKEFQRLREKLEALNSLNVKKLFDEKKSEFLRAVGLCENLNQRLLENSTLLDEKRASLVNMSELQQIKLESLEEIDKELGLLKEQIWNRTKLEKDLETKNIELEKIRGQFKDTRDEVQNIQKNIDKKTKDIEDLYKNLQTIVPNIDRNAIRELKNLKIKLETFLNIEVKFQKLAEVLALTRKSLEEKSKQSKKLEFDIQEIDTKKTEILQSLKVLNGEKASLLMQRLTQNAKTSSDNYGRHLELQKQQELSIKGAQGRLSQMDELSKEYDLFFSKELMSVKEISATLPDIFAKLRNLALDFNSSIDLFTPFSDLIREEKKNAKDLADNCRMSFSSVSTRLTEWEKVQDKIQLFMLQHQDISRDLARKLRLDEVLGKDELRTFVLSLVEENLILQTNEELQKLCQGRYEIVHQTKSLRMVPEFYILDKFREGGKRKVSTLSGGETFMVSLAMALGLAEMTRGKAEIDSLFIDEGFGTLDQDSLEDVLDMLQQIQTRGLLVGIISHIKALTESLPVNLRVTKGQNGTSTIDLRFN